MKRLIALLALAFLAACATAPQTPQQTIYSATNSYNAAVTVALAYKALPACAPTAPPICSRPDIVAKLKDADTVAYNALVAAENVARSPNAGANAQTALVAANQAIAAFAAITASLTVR